MNTTITSFGYLHAPFDADKVFDLRDQLADPHVTRLTFDVDGQDVPLREMTARDPRIRTVVMAHPDAAAIRDSIVDYVLSRPGPVRVGVGCAGGRHRSVTLAIEAGRALDALGRPVTVLHRDIDLDVVRR